MDDPALPADQLAGALRGLERLNLLSRAAPALWSHLRPLAAAASRPLRILDVATGSGDVLINVAARAARAGLPLELHACDLRQEMLDAARARAQSRGLSLKTFLFDATADTLPTGFDVAMVSLFCHHLTEAQVISLLRKLGACARHVIVSDLARSACNLPLVWLGAHLVTRSPIVHTDSVLSIRAAFTPGELGALAHAAGLRDIRLSPTPPARFIMTARSRT